MDNTENTIVEGTEQQPTGQSSPGKTFTQEDVNRIVQERLARDRGARTETSPDEREAELQQRELSLYLREQVETKGLPKEVAESFQGLNKETIDKCIQIIMPLVDQLKEPIRNPVGKTSGVGLGDRLRAAMGLN